MSRTVILLLIIPLTLARAQPLVDMDAHLARLAPQLQMWYEEIHRHPEIAKQEFQTARLVREALR